MTPARKALIDTAKRIMREHLGLGLIDYAVHDAMKGLVEHWSYALKDGSTPPDIVVNDLNEVIGRLCEVREELKAALPNAVERLAEDV